MKYAIRRLILRMSQWTARRWLNVEDIARAIDEDRYDDAQEMIDRSRERWHDDPELIRLDTMNRFLKGA